MLAWWIPVVTTAIASGLGVILYGVFGTVLGEDLVGGRCSASALVVAMLNTIAHASGRAGMRWATGR